MDKVRDYIILSLAVLGTLIQLLSLLVDVPIPWRVLSYLLLGISLFYLVIRGFILERPETSPASGIREGNNRLDRTTIDSSNIPEIVYGYIAERYGIGYSSIDVKFEIRRDGSAIVTRTIEIEAFSTIENLDTYLLIPERAADGTGRESKSIEVESLSSGDITITELKKLNYEQVSSATLTISPSLQPGGRFKYRMEELLPPSLYAIDRTQEQLSNRKSAYDYAGWNISRPSKKLRLNVHFPEYYRPTVFNAQVKYVAASVFPSEQIQHEEQEKISPKMILDPDGTHYIFNIEVDYPMTGLIYILRWKPVARESSGNQTNSSS